MCIESGDLPCCSSLSYQKPKRSHSQLTEYICMASTISDTTYYDGDEYEDHNNNEKHDEYCNNDNQI